MDGKMNDESIKSYYGTVGYWDGMEGYQFMLYGIRASEIQAPEPPDFAAWGEGIEYHYTELFEDDYYPIRMDLFEIYCPHWPDDLVCRLAEGMKYLLALGAIISFCMFEGAFVRIYSLFSTEWEITGTYGVAYPGQEPVLRLGETERADPAWAATLKAAEDYVYGLYPILKAIPPEW
jgi:hypothetical protein